MRARGSLQNMMLKASAFEKNTNIPTPRLPQEAGILRDVSRRPACPPSQALSSNYLRRDAPPSQAPSPKIQTKNQGLGARFLNGQGCGMNDLALEGHMIYTNDLGIEGHRNVRRDRGSIPRVTR